MKEVRASVRSPRPLRALSRYGVILATSSTTELLASICGWVGMKVFSVDESNDFDSIEGES